MTKEYLEESEVMNNYYSKLSYKKIDREAIKTLIKLFNHEIIGEKIERKVNDGEVYWVEVDKQNSELHFNDDGKLHYAIIYGNGSYFSKREIIRFCNGGIIEFSHSNDEDNLQPIYRAFKNWCYLIKKNARIDF